MTELFLDVVDLPFEEGVPTQEKVRRMKAWLSAHSDLYKNHYTVLYHATGRSVPVLEEGLKRTSATRRRSFQSRSGFVYLAPTPERARAFGDLGNGGNSIVYAVKVRVMDLRADRDQLDNQRSVGRDYQEDGEYFSNLANLGNSLAESLVYGGSAAYPKDIHPYDIRVWEPSLNLDPDNEDRGNSFSM